MQLTESDRNRQWQIKCSLSLTHNDSERRLIPWSARAALCVGMDRGNHKISSAS